MSLQKLGMILVFLLILAGCAEKPSAQPSESIVETQETVLSWNDLVPDHSLELRYATQFSVDFFQGGYAEIRINDTDLYFLVPEGAEVPQELPQNMVVLQQPMDHIYLVNSAAMDLFRQLNALDTIRLSGTEADGWFIPEAKQAMEDGRILYAGKYNAPDYELILSERCDLAVENTMIFHTPEVKEQLEQLGIPVLVDRSSYESDPLARMEWIKLYGVLLGKEDTANCFFDDLMAKLEPILNQPPTEKTVEFFFITASGMINVRKPSDYIAKCIDLAGGVYLFQGTSDDTSATATTTIQMESFYAEAKTADILIYNSSISGELETMDDLLELSDLLAGCKAVQEGNVWCAGKNLYQETLGLGNLILDIHAVLTADDPDSLELNYLHRLK